MVEAVQPKEGQFDRWHPGNVSPFVAYLATPGCEITGEVFVVGGSRVKPAGAGHRVEAHR